METKSGKKRIITITVFCLVLVLTGVLTAFLWTSGFFDTLGSMEQMRDYIERYAPYSSLLFFLIQLLSVLLAPIPSNVSSMAGAALFGVLRAFLLTCGAVALGSVTVFWMTRVFGRQFAERFAKKRDMERYMDFLHRKRDVFFAAAFLLPGFPDDLLCFLAGLTDMSMRRFIVLVVLFRPWGLFASCLIGGNLHHFPLPLLIALGVFALLLVCAAVKYGERWEMWVLQKIERGH